MTRRERLPIEIEQLKFISDKLVQLCNMAQRIRNPELSLLIGVAALAAFELETDDALSCRMEQT